LGNLNITQAIDGLKLVAKDLNGDKDHEYQILSVKADNVTVNDFTLMHKDSSVLLSLYASESISDLGFRLLKKTCWSHFSEFVSDVKLENIKISVILGEQQQQPQI